MPVGAAISAAYTFPVTCAAVAYPVAFTMENPVIYDAAAGLIPRSPVMAEVGTLVIADFARIT